MEPEEHPGFDYTFDLENRVAIHRDGYHAPIVDMFDEDYEQTLDPDEVAVVYFRMPPEGVLVGFDLKAYEASLDDPSAFETEH